MDATQLEALIAQHFPQAHDFCQITSLHGDEMGLRMPCRPDMLRPGGTISGPALMGLADLGAYLLILSQLGPVVLAVTSSLNIHFLRKPEAHDVLAIVRMLKRGKQLVVCEVQMSSALDQQLIAQATVTYSIPPR
ncbi:MAG TPA: PaaI family thioesterase [Polyangiales bacterium]